jgi:hypothetical protein
VVVHHVTAGSRLGLGGRCGGELVEAWVTLRPCMMAAVLLGENAARVQNSLRVVAPHSSGGAPWWKRYRCDEVV